MERRMPPDETAPEASDDRMAGGGASPASGSPQGARGSGRGDEGGGGARQGRPPVRRALSKLASLVDPPTALASAVAALLSIALLWAGVAFCFRNWSRDLRVSDFVGYAYMALALCVLFAPLAVGGLVRKRRGPSGGSIVLTWFACVPASLVLLFALSFAYVPHASPHIAPFWFVYGVAMPLQAIGDGLIWLVGLLIGGQLR